MSSLFFDHLIKLDSIDKHIKKTFSSNEERQEVWFVVEDIIQHRVLGCCLTNLPRENHHEFLEKFSLTPHDKRLIDYIEEKVKKDMRKIIRQEVQSLAKDLLSLDSNKMKPSLKNLKK